MIWLILILVDTFLMLAIGADWFKDHRIELWGIFLITFAGVRQFSGWGSVCGLFAICLVAFFLITLVVTLD